MILGFLLRPLKEAIKRFSLKSVIGSILRTREWEQLPQQLREKAFFSAGLENTRVAQRMSDGIKDALTLAREPDRADGTPGKFKMNRANFISDMRKLAIDEGLTPAEPNDVGTLKDITSPKRLALIFRTNMDMAREYARWKYGQDAALLQSAPAQELVRESERKVPRNWIARWKEAGGQFFAGKMIALKTDPIWEHISRFKNPWPPFDFNSGMGVKNVKRKAAEALGLLGKGEKLKPVLEEFNARMEATVKDLSPRMRGSLRAIFGDQIEVDGDTVRWKGESRGLANSRPTQPRDSLGRWVDENGGGLSERDNLARGKKAMRRAIRKKTDVRKAMHRKGLGQIDFVWGTPGHSRIDYKHGFGISHALAKHGEKDVMQIPNTLLNGKILRDPLSPEKRIVAHGRHLVALVKDKSRSAWVLTGYKDR